MSAVLGIFGSRQASERIARSMLSVMRYRGDEIVEISCERGGTLGVSRFAWECEPDLSGSAGALRVADIVVVADATIYHRDDLKRKLKDAGIALSGPTPSHLILDAYRAWGTACAGHLEGDYAFVVWDTARRIAYCARSFTGLRPLYYGVYDGTFAVASTLGGVRAHPACSDDLNLRAIGAVAAGQMYSLGAETCYQDVHAVPGGTSLSWDGRRVTGPTRAWQPKPDPRAARLTFPAAADELRQLLTEAVRERLPSQGTACVWMSGGWDSTAVFAAGKEAIQQDHRGVDLRPVCISYPPGDPGREDELIESVVRHWNTEAHWLDSREIPLFDDLESAAAHRDEAPALLYGPWNAALAAGSRDCGARIAFDGNGGDQLFGTSGGAFLADLLVSLRWIPLVEELWVRRSLGTRYLLRTLTLPILPPWALALAKQLRGGRPLGHYMDRPVPAWIRAEFVRRYSLVESERSGLPRPGLRDVAQREVLWFLTTPFVAWAMGRIAELALAEGVELRSPLLDARIIAFALGRPWHDRSRGRETKRLLRAAMRDLLPVSVLAPRPRRTGVTIGYSRHWMKRSYPALFERLFKEPLEVEKLGIVDAHAWHQAADDHAQGRVNDYDRVHLHDTLEVELWLRSRTSSTHVAASREAATYPGREETCARSLTVSSKSPLP